MKKQHNQNRWLRLAALLLMAIAIPTASQAQFGGLGKKIKSAAKSVEKKVSDVEKKVSDVEKKVGEVTGTATGQTTTPATSAASSSSSSSTSSSETSDSEIPVMNKTSFYKGNWRKAEYNRDTKQFVYEERTYESGAQAGKPVTYNYDEATGEVRDAADGSLKGTVNKEFVDIPGIGKVYIVGEKGYLSFDRKMQFGIVTAYNCVVWGKEMCSTGGQKEQRELIAFYSLAEIGSKEKLASMEKDYNSRAQRRANAAAAFKQNLKTITAGNFQDLAGNKLGSMVAGGKVLNKTGSQIGLVKVNGTNTEIYDAFNHRLGYISETGGIYKGAGNAKVGQLQETGSIQNTRGENLGSINGNDFYDSKSNRVGSFSGKGVYVAAALTYFFFNF